MQRKEWIIRLIVSHLIVFCPLDIFAVPIVAFFNVYADNIGYESIHFDQLQTMNRSGLMRQIDTIYYTAFGKYSSNVTFGDSTRFVRLLSNESGGEIDTLSLLHIFCRSNPDAKVLYFHNKGSHHQNSDNLRFRRALDCFVLTPHCLPALDRFDICGWRISPIPTPHYSGNFWWARCSYVAKLVNPVDLLKNGTFLKLSSSISGAIHHTNRFFAEHWIASYPIFHPADCMSLSVLSTYLYGYKIPDRILGMYCPKRNMTSSGFAVYGSGSCGRASTFKINQFLRAQIDVWFRFGGVNPTMFGQVILRSLAMYGDLPSTFIRWLQPIVRYTLYDQRLIRGTQLYSQKYYYLNRSMLIEIQENELAVYTKRFPLSQREISREAIASTNQDTGYRNLIKKHIGFGNITLYILPDYMIEIMLANDKLSGRNDIKSPPFATRNYF